MENFIFGIRAVTEAIESGKSIDKIMLRKELGSDLARELLDKLRERDDIYVQRVPAERLDRITRKNHQGVIAFISPVTYHPLDHLLPSLYESSKTPLLLILDSLTDTRNFGAIGRTADCAGIDGIILPRRNSVSVTPDAVKTSAGGLFYVPVCRERSLAEAVEYLRQSGVKIVAASEKAAIDYTESDMKVPVAIVMGNEETGISPELLRMCDELVRIPMLGHIGSLNVSVAAGVMMYEAVRQRNEQV